MSASATATTTGTFDLITPSPQIKELTPGFGVEVKGLDFTNGVGDASHRLIQELATKAGCTHDLSIPPLPLTLSP